MPAGFQPGKGSTFTPSSRATWIDDFNKLLEDSKLSRNQLVETLIQEALAQRKYGNLAITPQEYEIIKILRNSGSTNANPINVKNEKRTSQKTKQIEEKPAIEYDQKPMSKPNINNALARLNQQMNGMNFE